jgi:SAM-dependent methyltransferase
MTVRRRSVGVLLALASSIGACAAGSEPARQPEPTPAAEQPPPSREPDVVFFATPQAVVDKMLELAQVTNQDVVYDLGCGDGRIVITAAKRYGARAFGFDIDPKRVEEAKRNVEANGVGNLVTIERRDIFELDLSAATVVTLYLLPGLNQRLIPQLLRLPPGARIVSHQFPMPGVEPDQMLDVDQPGQSHVLYLWHAPIHPASEPSPN